MKKFYSGVVKCQKAILTIFFLLAVVCIFLQQMIAVNYDINDYLPEDSSSTISLDVMSEEFEGGIPNARAMIRNVTIPEALEYKEQLLQLDGVTEVTWLDDAADITIPLSIMDSDMVETYYKDGNALFTITIDEEKNLQAVEDIRELIGSDNALTGNAVSTADATTSTIQEIKIIVVVAIILAIIILTITTTSWAEPFVILLGLGVAIVINAGTNLIFGEISFVTNAAGNILQLAVSTDYSVFLIHRFEECRKENSNPKAAMIEALCKSTSSIMSSGLTTVIGFLALVLMKFRIGPDLGLALAKGVAISLITVFIFMPCFILATHKLIDKTRHRPFLPGFKWLGKLISRIMIPACCLFALVIVPSYLASNSNEYYYGSEHIFGTDTRIGADTEAINDIFGKNDTYVLLVPKGDLSTEKLLSDELHELPEVTSIISYVDTVGAEIPSSYLSESILSQLSSENYDRMVISVSVGAEGNETFTLVENVRSIAEKHYPGTWYLAGAGVSTYDLMDTTTKDMTKVNLVAIGAVFLVLLISMKSLTLPIQLVLSIETAIWINLSMPYFRSAKVFYIAYLIISSIQLGATVDYAILMADRYKEYRETLGKKDAVIHTIDSVTVSILTSSTLLTSVGFLLGYLSSHGLLAQLGMFLGIGALCSLAIVFFVLPGLLYLFDGTFVKKDDAKGRKSKPGKLHIALPGRKHE